MLSTIMISRSLPLITYTRQVCAEFPDICIYKVMWEESQNPYGLARAIAAYAPEVVFLELDPVADPEERLQEIYSVSPTAAVVPIGTECGEELTQALARLGLPKALVPPYSAEELEAAVLSSMRRGITGGAKIWSFVPSKPGSGSSLIALNTAHRLVHAFGKRVLLIETDDYAGMLTGVLGAWNIPRPPKWQAAPELDDLSWPQIRCECAGVDTLLGTETRKLTGSSRWSISRLLRFAQTRYDFVLLDVARMDDPRIGISLSRSHKVCLISEFNEWSLYFAEKRCEELASLGVAANRISRVVNGARSANATSAAVNGWNGKIAASVPHVPAASVFEGKECGIITENAAFERAVMDLTVELSGLKPLASYGKGTWLSGLFKAG